MINQSSPGNIRAAVPSNHLSSSASDFGENPKPAPSIPHPFVTLVETYSDYVWRTVRRLGVRERDVDDAAQQVLWVAARKLDSIRAGSERSFLLQTAIRVAGTQRRTYARRREEMHEANPEASELVDRGPSSDELLTMRRAREQLDAILDQMPLDLRAVFVLHELEEETMADIAAMLGIPAGTAASRLRRARTLFYECVARESPSERSAR